MKKVQLLLCFLLVFAFAKAQYVNIPDSNFRSLLISYYPSCFNSAGQMDTSCFSISSIKNLILNYNQTIKNLDGIQYFKNLEFLDISSSTIKFINQLPNSLIYLRCNGDTDIILNKLPNNLKNLDCNFCNLDSLPEIPKGILTLSAESNKIKKLPFLGDSLIWFSCKNNLIDSVLNLPNTLKRFNCDTNQIKFISKLPDSLWELNCNQNNLKYLPIINNKLLYFSVGSNNLDSIDISQSNIYRFNCSNNSTKGNWKLNANLNELSCKNNQIKRIKNLPFNLENLFCSDNNIDTLIELNYFKMLDCHNNQLTYLLIKTDSLLYLDCTDNDIRELQNVIRPNKDMYGYRIHNNPNLSCLPILDVRHISYGVFFQNTKIKCVSFKPIYPSGDLINIPFCNATNNTNNCQYFPVIRSFVYNDLNNNNKYDTAEIVKSNVRITLLNKNYSYTNKQGIAYMNADSLGTYTITAQAPNFYNAVPPSYTHTFSSYDTIVYDTFALQATVLKDSIAIKLTPTNWAARPGFIYPYLVQYENVGTTVLSNAVIGLNYNNGLLNYDSSSNNTVSNNGNSLSLNIGNVTPGQTGSFIAYFTVKTTATLGSNVVSIANITTNTVSANDTVKTTIRGSYDPNDKQATPSLTLQDVGDGKNIDYTIRFQNTGTDTAFTVVIADTLDTKLQANQLQMVGSSHLCKTTVKDNIIFFEFLDILLPDSNTNKIGSNGFVSFKIKPINTVTAGTIIPNNAAIYFDYNKPIFTNIANTAIQFPLPVNLLNFNAIPQQNIDKILVYWNTSNEVNTSHFIIEQSTNGKDFIAAAEVVAKGSGSNSYFYSIDKNKVNYVRLKMVDKNGQFTYSNIIKLVISNEQLAINISPNPAKNKLNIIVYSNKLNNTAAKIVNAKGQIIKTFILKQGYTTIDITGFAAGVYYLQSNEGAKKFVVVN